MRTALGRYDVIGKRHDGFVIAVVILNGDLCRFIIGLIRHINDVVKHFAMLDGVEMLNKALDTALVAKLVGNEILGSGVCDGNFNACVEESLLTHTIEDGNVIKYGGFRKDFGVGHKTDVKTVLFAARADVCKRARHLTSFKAFGIHFACMTVFHLCPKRKCVDDRGTDAMKTAGEFITACAEFTACVQDRENDLQRGNTELLIDTARNTAAVILNRYAAVGVEGHLDLRTNSRHCFVNGVIYDFINKVVQTSLRRGADIHTGTFSDCFEPFQYLNLTVFIDAFVGVVSFRHKLFFLS